jgi:hypothetical protein
MKFTERQRHLWVEAINDDPGGLTHPIWAELGIPPQPPVSAEERWLIDEAIRTGNDELASTKVWDQDTNGNWVKLWTLTPAQAHAEREARLASSRLELERQGERP